MARINLSPGDQVFDPDGKQIWPPEIQVVQAMGVCLAAVSTKNLRMMTFAEEKLGEFLSSLPKDQQPCFITDGQGNVHDEAFGFWEGDRAILTPGVMPKMTPWLDTVTRRNAHMDQCGFNRNGREYDWPYHVRAERIDKLQSQGAFTELFAQDKFEDGLPALWRWEPYGHTSTRFHLLDYREWYRNVKLNSCSAVPLRTCAVEPR